MLHAPAWPDTDDPAELRRCFAAVLDCVHDPVIVLDPADHRVLDHMATAAPTSLDTPRVLEKPFTPDQLIETVRRALDAPPQ